MRENRAIFSDGHQATFPGYTAELGIYSRERVLRGKPHRVVLQGRSKAMLWDESNQTDFQIMADMIDVSFRLKGKCLAVNHHHTLAEVVSGILPWLRSESRAGIHPIQVAPTAHGWSPPKDQGDALWQLSKRTRLRLRVPEHRKTDVALLEGTVLDLEPEPIGVGPLKIHKLAPTDPLFARHVVSEPDVSEPYFVDWIINTLQAQGINPRKVLCGKWHAIRTPDKTIHTRSVLVASLSLEASIRLQCAGLGQARRLGCGIFVPHKGIDALDARDEQG